MNIYYEINNNILNNYQKQNRNYQILKNIQQININNEILNKIKNINNANNIKNTFFEMIDLYNNINSDDNIIIGKEQDKKTENKIINEDKSLSDKLNEMTIIYKIDKNQDEIRIFGEYFIENNKDNCILVIGFFSINFTFKVSLFFCLLFNLKNSQS